MIIVNEFLTGMYHYYYYYYYYYYFYYYLTSFIHTCYILTLLLMTRLPFKSLTTPFT
jgi:hypothetical protein